MIRTPTVFVIGAGASCELGFPTGNDLRKQISNSLSFDRGGGSDDLRSELIEIVQRRVVNTDIQGIFKIANEIKKAMGVSISIDNYIQTHDDESAIKLVGKMAIADVILKKEKESILCSGHAKHINIHTNMENRWHKRFLDILVGGSSKGDPAKIFDNVKVICFNYDRCIQRWLPLALREYYGIPLDEAVLLSRKLTIIHPYGNLGTLYQGESSYSRFGEAYYTNQLLNIANTLKTFSEGVAEEKVTRAVGDTIGWARHLVFLGFSFHRMNMDILNAATGMNATMVLGTGLGLSGNDIEVAKSQIRTFWKGGGSESVLLHTDIGQNYDCRKLLEEYGRTLGQ